MPLSLEPGIPLAVWLDIDEPKPIDSRPLFLVRSMTMRQQAAMEGEIQESIKGKTTYDGIFDEYARLFYKYVHGWKNMGSFEYGCDLRDLLDSREVRQILGKIESASYVQYEEKKS